MVQPERVLRKVGWRLVPFLMLLYFVNFLDRVNVGFAALAMNKAIGLSPAVYGWGAGIFFLGYFLFEVPSNLLLQRVGARLWIARIMVTWGVVSTAMAWVSGPASFITLRFLLGIAEAGFFPGIILYLTFWFPAAYRARIVAAFFMAVPLSSVFGNPVSAWVLGLDGWLGFEGWRWLFAIEGVPAIVLGFVVLGYLGDGPAKAAFLAPEEREWLCATIAAEDQARATARPLDLRAALLNGMVWMLAGVYFGLVMALYGIALWLPQLANGFGLSLQQIGFVTAVPYIVATLGMVVWGRRSDAKAERTWHVAIPGFIAAAGLIATPFAGSPVLSLVCLCVAAFGIYAAIPVFWTLPAGFLSGTAAAGAIGLINALGNLGGFAGPSMVGFVREETGSFAAGLVVLGLASLGAGLLALAARAEPPKTGDSGAG
jgi:D-galactonate transporter